MSTTTNLIRTLSEALGIEHKAVNHCARFLREAGYLPTGRVGRDGAAEITPEHATNLLLALIAPQSSRSAPARMELYAQLPFEGVTRSELMPDGRYALSPLADDDPFVEGMRAGGDTFGEFLQSYIIAFNEIPEMDTTLGGIFVGGGAGNAFAAVRFSAFADGVGVGGSVRFGRYTHDAPLVGLDTNTSVPGAIIRVLHDLLTGAADGRPRATGRVSDAAEIDSPRPTHGRSGASRPSDGPTSPRGEDESSTGVVGARTPEAA